MFASRSIGFDIAASIIIPTIVAIALFGIGHSHKKKGKTHKPLTPEQISICFVSGSAASVLVAVLYFLSCKGAAIDHCKFPDNLSYIGPVLAAICGALGIYASRDESKSKDHLELAAYVGSLGLVLVSVVAFVGFKAEHEHMETYPTATAGALIAIFVWGLITIRRPGAKLSGAIVGAVLLALLICWVSHWEAPGSAVLACSA